MGHNECVIGAVTIALCMLLGVSDTTELDWIGFFRFFSGNWDTGWTC